MKSRKTFIDDNQHLHSKDGGPMNELPVDDGQVSPNEDRASRGEEVGRYGRRALMLGAATGVGVAAGLVAGAEPASAAEDGAVLAGQINTATSNTAVSTSVGNGLEGDTSQNGESGVYGHDTSSGGGHGVVGRSTNGNGVYGTASTAGQSGVYGNDGSTAPFGGYGVQGVSANGTGVYGVSANGTGVYGVIYGDTSGMSGVYGADSSTGTGGGAGVQGSSINGTGLYGDSSYGNGVYGGSADGNGVFGNIYGDTSGTSGVYGNDGTTGADGGYGVQGQSTNGFGVYGVSINGFGVLGSITGDTNDYVAVEGFDQSVGGGVGVYGQSTNGFGVYGKSSTDGKSGVFGEDESSGGGCGVQGVSTNGIGVLASNTSGTALQVEGVDRLSRSGMATVAGTASKSKTSITVPEVALSASSMILTTPQGHVPGVAVAGVVPAVSAGSFTIYLTKAVNVSLPIAWFIVDLAPEAAPLNGDSRPTLAKPTIAPAIPHVAQASPPLLRSIPNPVQVPGLTGTTSGDVA
jgi:hypothetical protein